MHLLYLLQRNIYLPVKCTARIVDYLTAKYPLIELARAQKYIVNPKQHFFVCTMSQVT